MNAKHTATKPVSFFAKIESETSLTNQPRGPQLEYRVKAVNVGGESIPSNTLAVVL